MRKTVLGMALFLAAVGVLIQLMGGRGATVKATSLERAIAVGSAAATEWRPNAELQFLTSQDNEPDVRSSRPPGIDGRRRSWLLQFKDPGTDEAVFVAVGDGKVIKVDPMGIDQAPGINPSDVNVQASKLVAEARSLGLSPGVKWAIGYHFRLVRQGSTYYVEVVGLGKDGARTSILFDVHTGRPVVAHN